MSSDRTFVDYLKDHYADVDSEKLAQIYESNYHAGDFMSIYSSAFNTVNLNKWVESDKCTWTNEKKMDFALQYVYAKETCDQFEAYLKDCECTKARFNKWKTGKPTVTHPAKNDIKKLFDEIKKKTTTKKPKKEKEHETSLKVSIKPPKKDSSDKKEESKPKKE